MQKLLQILSDPVYLTAILSEIITLGVLCIGCSKRAWKYRMSSPLFLYAAVSFLLVIAEFYAAFELKVNNHIISNLWKILELGLIGLFFYRLLKSYRKIIVPVLLICVLFYGLDTYQMGSLQVFSGITDSVFALVFISFSIMGFYDLFVSEEVPNLLSTSVFWFLTAILFYFSGSLFSFLMSDMIVMEAEANAGLWYVHNVFNMMKYVFLGIGFLRINSLATLNPIH